MTLTRIYVNVYTVTLSLVVLLWVKNYGLVYNWTLSFDILPWVEDNDTSLGHWRQLSDSEILSISNINKTEHIYCLDTYFFCMCAILPWHWHWRYDIEGDDTSFDNGQHLWEISRFNRYILVEVSCYISTTWWVSVLVDQCVPRAHVAKSYSRLRLIRSVLRASKFSVSKWMKL